MVALRISTKSISFVKIIILARILAPSQFGAYGVALLVVGFLEVMTETGVNVILVQEKNSNRYIDSAWIVSVARGILISLLIIVLTPFISSFFSSPDSSILLYLISIVPLLRGFVNPSIVKLQKELRFNVEFAYRSFTFWADTIVAIVFTLILKNPVGIIIGLIFGVLLEVILSYKIIKPIPRLSLDRQYINKIIHRGKWITAGGFLNYIFHHIDDILVGRIMGTESLGIYQVAYSLAILPITEIAEVFSRVTFPVFTKIAMDSLRLKAAFIKTMLAISFLTIPFGIILFLFSKEIILITLGEKWLGASQILPILGMFGVIRAISGSSSSLFLAVGKQKYVTVVTFASTLFLLILIVPLIFKFGLLGAAYSALAAATLAVPIFIYYTLKILASNDKR